MYERALVSDPIRREDEMCARPNCTRSLSFNKRAELHEMYANEPFCSTECCKFFHGIATEKPEAAFARRRSAHVEP
jgi:hypothetical protein